jgi:hypothetical protein
MTYVVTYLSKFSWLLDKRTSTLLSALFPVGMFIILVFLTCSNPTDPPDHNGAKIDTTSHDFVWQIDTLGDRSSILFDVAVIDENNIWAVGEIFIGNSTPGGDAEVYNLARWDGTKWNLLRVMFPICGTEDSAPFLARSIFAFSSTNVWLSSAGTIARFKNNSYDTICIPSDLLPGSINRMWGKHDESVYVVGNLGTIVHYNGTGWQRLESGTELNIHDIWGSVMNNRKEMLAVASKTEEGLDRKVLLIDNDNVEILSDSGIVREPLSGVWFTSGKKYYVIGSGIYRKNSLDEPVWKGTPLELTEFYSSGIRGNDTNDVFIVGAFGDVLHYNGSTWRQYPELRINGGYFRVAVKGNDVAAVGWNGQRAAVVIGKRN